MFAHNRVDRHTATTVGDQKSRFSGNDFGPGWGKRPMNQGLKIRHEIRLGGANGKS